MRTIANTHRPFNINELRTFLGMANYCNKCIPKMNYLRKKYFTWTSRCTSTPRGTTYWTLAMITHKFRWA